MSKQLEMKFMLQLHKLPTCVERKGGQEWALSKNEAEQTWTSHQVTFGELEEVCRRRRTGKPEKKFVR